MYIINYNPKFYQYVFKNNLYEYGYITKRAICMIIPIFAYCILKFPPKIHLRDYNIYIEV